MTTMVAVEMMATSVPKKEMTDDEDTRDYNDSGDDDADKESISPKCEKGMK